MSDFLKKLQDLNEQAAKDKLATQALFDAELEKKRQEHLALAPAIIAKIEDTCIKAAASGETSARIMSLAYGSDKGFSDISRFPKFNEDMPLSELGVTAKAVAAHCIHQLKMTPQIIEITDGGGMRSDYYLILDWKKGQARY